MIKIIDGMIKSLQEISRHLKGHNQNAYRWLDQTVDMLEVERKQRACGNRPAIISEDTIPCPDYDVVKSYTGEKGKDYWRGSV